MIDEKKLLDWLTQRKNDSLGSDRLVYRELLSRIEKGEFSMPDPTDYDTRFPGAREKYLGPSYDYSRVRLNEWVDNDDQW